MIKNVFNDGTHQVNYGTNGTSRPHMTKERFESFAKETIKKHKEHYGK
jgi:hypothetical protein